MKWYKSHAYTNIFVLNTGQLKIFILVANTTLLTESFCQMKLHLSVVIRLDFLREKKEKVVYY